MGNGKESMVTALPLGDISAGTGVGRETDNATALTVMTETLAL